MHTFVFETRRGALMSYGADLSENYRLAAGYIDQILRGAKVADLPFQEPTRLTLSINLGTATVPPYCRAPLAARARRRGHRMSLRCPVLAQAHVA